MLRNWFPVAYLSVIRKLKIALLKLLQTFDKDFAKGMISDVMLELISRKINMKDKLDFRRLILLANLLVLITLSCNANVSLMGIWGVSQNENAVFEINADSICYVDEFSQFKYKTKGDSLFIQMDENSIIRYKYILGDDVLTIINGKVSKRYIRMKSGRTPIIGTCSIGSGFKYISSRIENLITFATLNLTFSNYATMKVGSSYLVAKVGDDFRPDSDQIVEYIENGRKWMIEIKSTGDIYFKIVSGPDLKAVDIAKFDKFKYSLF